jgi:hypothetical protein
VGLLVLAVLAGGVLLGRRSVAWYLPPAWLVVGLVIGALVIADEVVVHVGGG